MNNNEDCQRAVLRPEPKRRPPLPRMNKIQENSITMAGKKGRGRNTSNGSSPVTCPLSTAYKKGISPTKECEFETSRESPASGLYSDSSASDCSKRDELIGSNLENLQSSSDTTSTSFSISDENSCEQIFSNASWTSERQQNSPERGKVNKRWSDAEDRQNWKNIYGSLLIAVAIGIYYFASPATEAGSDEIDLESRLSDLENLFPSQDQDIWMHFGSGIADVRSRNHSPAIFILLASHEETTTCLAERVAELAQSVLNGNGDVILTPEKLENNVSKVFTLIENRMNKTKAVVIPDMLNIRSIAIKAFHDAIDEYSPLVAEAVYLFTMNFGGHEQSESLTSIVEQQLRKRYSSDIKEDTLRALIVRFTAGVVLAIKKENKIPCNK